MTDRNSMGVGAVDSVAGRHECRVPSSRLNRAGSWRHRAPSPLAVDNSTLAQPALAPALSAGRFPVQDPTENEACGAYRPHYASLQCSSRPSRINTRVVDRPVTPTACLIVDVLRSAHGDGAQGPALRIWWP